ncbi:hypothetical protein L218DRAFT_884858 [Marasmius fiardii PR-910]|nr:hypothetical protein L218DRAFT_884858 [Marasmius fiardii PR-910]
MRYVSFVIAATVLCAPVLAVSVPPTAAASLQANLRQTMTKTNHYGAPIPPWQIGCRPGWYYGDNHGQVDPSIPWRSCISQLTCSLLDLVPLGILHCPKAPYHPPHGGNGNGGDNDGYYKEVFDGCDGAVQADDYITFGLVDSVDDCKAMCRDSDECNFINTYHDVKGKDGSPLLTCSLFSKCHTKGDAINKGGQTQPDGSINRIADSAGYCKDTSENPYP